MKSIKRLMYFSIILLLMQVCSITTAAESADNAANDSEKTSAVHDVIGVKNPATDLWRAIRQGQFNEAGGINTSSQIKGLNSGLLINSEGNKWRQLRTQKLLPYSAYFIGGVVVLLALMFVFIRRVKIPDGRSGKKIERMSQIRRISHWLMAILVGFLAITGLLLFFGRFAIIPLIGAEAFSPIASASKEGHNLFAPLLIVSLLLMLIYFIRQNWPARGDLKWLLTGGGLFTKKHLKIGFFNAGEKILFWATIVLGIVLSVTGLMLLFPYYEQTINMSQLALVIHAIAALLLIALSLAHIFMTTKVEGTIDAMTSGNVDQNWAKAHHSQWYEEQSKKSVSVKEDSTTRLDNDLSGTDREGAF